MTMGSTAAANSAKMNRITSAVTTATTVRIMRNLRLTLIRDGSRAPGSAQSGVRLKLNDR